MTPADLQAIDDEPSLVRPYVQLEVPEGIEAPPSRQPDEPGYHARHAGGSPDEPGAVSLSAAETVPAPPLGTWGDSEAAAGGPKSRKRARRPRRGRRRRLFAASGIVTALVALGFTVLTLDSAEPGRASAPQNAWAAPPERHGPQAATLPAPAAATATPADPSRAASGAAYPGPSGSAPAVGAPAETSSPGGGGPAAGTGTPVPSQQQAAGDGIGTIIGPAGLCLDGARLRAWTCDGSAGQRWTVGGDGTVRTLGRCLDGADRPVLSDCDGTAAQRWRAGPGPTLVGAASGLCLQAPDGDSRGALRMAACSSDAGQHWVLP